jgi:hypothetical protein
MPAPALQTIHAIQRDGTILKGTEALKALYSAVDLGWAAQFGDLPIISDVSSSAAAAAAAAALHATCCARRVWGRECGVWGRACVFV